MIGKDIYAALAEGLERIESERKRMEQLCAVGKPHTLYLDFDGVLHSSDTWLPADGRPPYCDDGELFEWAPFLVDALIPFPSVRIILSTTWVVRLGFEIAVQYLPSSLQERVISATYQGPQAQYASQPLPRGEIVRIDAVRRGLDFSEWLAIDDDPEGWGDARDRLILTRGGSGISDSVVQTELRRLLNGESSQF